MMVNESLQAKDRNGFSFPRFATSESINVKKIKMFTQVSLYFIPRNESYVFVI